MFLRIQTGIVRLCRLDLPVVVADTAASVRPYRLEVVAVAEASIHPYLPAAPAADSFEFQPEPVGHIPAY